jgi:hypothetical protein
MSVRKKDRMDSVGGFVERGPFFRRNSRRAESSRVEGGSMFPSYPELQSSRESMPFQKISNKISDDPGIRSEGGILLGLGGTAMAERSRWVRWSHVPRGI